MTRAQHLLSYLTLLLNSLLVFIWAMEEHLTELPVWLKVGGRLHPLLLHFPISLLLIICLLEICFRKTESVRAAINLLLSVTAFTAALTALAGFFLFYSGGYENSADLYWHKVTGILTSVIAGGLSWLKTRPNLVFYYGTLFVGSTMVVVAGHLGASVTHGKDFLTEPIMAGTPRFTDLGKAKVYGDIIQDIISEKCISCHNPDKQKGDLLMTDYAALMKGGENGKVIIKGNADSSALYKMLLLHPSDELHMPPEGKPQPDAGEISLIGWWINTGADEKKTVNEIAPPDSIMEILVKKYGNTSPLDQLDISFAKPATIKALNNNDRGVRQLSVKEPYLSVFLANRKSIEDKEFDELKTVSSQVTSMDLSSSKLSSAQYKSLAKFPQLQTLRLQNSNVTDADITSLSSLKYLRHLNLSGTKITQAALQELSKLKSLDKLILYETAVPFSSLASLRKDRPGTFIGYAPDLTSDSSYRGKLTSPKVEIDSNMFLKSATVTIDAQLRGTEIRYTTDGTIPGQGSLLYTKPIEIERTCSLKVIAMKKDWDPSPVLAFGFKKAVTSFVSAKLSSPPDPRYQGRLDTTLIDLSLGSRNHTDGQYIGFEGIDLEVRLDFGVPNNISGISVSYITNHPAFLHAPVAVEVWELDDENRVRKMLGKTQLRETKFEKTAKKGTLEVSFQPTNLSRVKVRVVNRKKTPSWHTSPGSKSWIFIDEIMAR